MTDKKQFRCSICKALLAKYKDSGNCEAALVEIKCKRCKQVSVLSLKRGVTKHEDGQNSSSIV